MKINKTQLIALLLMLVAATIYRAMPGRPWGFAPQWSIALFSGALFVKDKKYAFLFPLGDSKNNILSLPSLHTLAASKTMPSFRGIK